LIEVVLFSIILLRHRHFTR